MRFSVAAVSEGHSVTTTEFFSLDRARLHVWALALEGHTARISKVIYDTIPSPAVALGSAIIETWDERSAFILLNGELRS